MATAPVAPPLTNYYTANDSSPGSQVWDLAAGAFVNVSNATFLAWLAELASAPVGAPYYPFNLQILSAISSDGGTTTTFNVDNTTVMTTGAVYNISATGLYDGQFALTVVSGTQLKTSQAFTSSATGQISGAKITATIASVYAAIDAVNRALPIPKYATITLSGSPTAISVPLALVTDVTPNTSDGAVLSLPQANLFKSPPVGQPFTFVGQGSGSTIHNWVLKDFGGNTIGTFGSNEGVIVWNTSNASSAGTLEGFRTRNVSPPAADAQILTSGSSWQQTFVWLASTPSGDVSMADGGIFKVLGNNGIANVAPTSFSPTDQSGASLTFTSVNVQYTKIGNIVHVYGTLTYPNTASGLTAKFSLPVAVPNQTYAQIQCANGWISAGGGGFANIQPVPNSSNAQVVNAVGTALANSALSLAQVTFMLIYPAS